MKKKKQFLIKIGKRLLGFVGAMFLLSVIVFYFARLAPGDPLQSFYGDAVESMTVEEQDAARMRLGLDGPIPVSYTHLTLPTILRV